MHGKQSVLLTQFGAVPGLCLYCGCSSSSSPCGTLHRLQSNTQTGCAGAQGSTTAPHSRVLTHARYAWSQVLASVCTAAPTRTHTHADAHGLARSCVHTSADTRVLVHAQLHTNVHPRPSCRGSVEYTVPEAYQTRTSMEPWHVFAIEVTAAALTSGATATVCAAVKEGLSALKDVPRSRVAIVTFDQRVQFYAFPGDAGGTARMVVMSDIAVRCPCPPALLRWPGAPLHRRHCA